MIKMSIETLLVLHTCKRTNTHCLQPDTANSLSSVWDTSSEIALLRLHNISPKQPNSNRQHRRRFPKALCKQSSPTVNSNSSCAKSIRKLLQSAGGARGGRRISHYSYHARTHPPPTLAVPAPPPARPRHKQEDGQQHL